jgi:LDH2 family malate/lactate/ureidoglycolate dehydrogenase
MDTPEVHYIQSGQLKRAFHGVLGALKVDAVVAHHVVEGLVQTSLRGVDSHGIRLFPHYAKVVKAGRVNGHPKYTFHKGGESVGRLDADHTYGHAAGAEAMKYVLDMARQTGCGAVAVYNSSHFGAAAYCGLMAAEKDMIGISLTHADALMLATNGIRAFFGTNPICVTAPVEGEGPFCLDMATTTITWNKVKMHREKNLPLAHGLAASKTGESTTDPHAAESVLPIGGYKGFGLGMVVDILCGLLSGMPFGREITSMYLTPLDQKRYLGQFYLALDISKFQDVKEFKVRLKKYMEQIRQEPAKDPAKPVLVPGDPEKQALIQRSQEGIPLSPYEYNAILETCRQYKVPFNDD